MRKNIVRLLWGLQRTSYASRCHCVSFNKNMCCFMTFGSLLNSSVEVVMIFLSFRRTERSWLVETPQITITQMHYLLCDIVKIVEISYLTYFKICLVLVSLRHKLFEKRYKRVPMVFFRMTTLEYFVLAYSEFFYYPHVFYLDKTV